MSSHNSRRKQEQTLAFADPDTARDSANFVSLEMQILWSKRRCMEQWGFRKSKEPLPKMLVSWNRFQTDELGVHTTICGNTHTESVIKHFPDHFVCLVWCLGSWFAEKRRKVAELRFLWPGSHSRNRQNVWPRQQAGELGERVRFAWNICRFSLDGRAKLRN